MYQVPICLVKKKKHLPFRLEKWTNKTNTQIKTFIFYCFHKINHIHTLRLKKDTSILIWQEIKSLLINPEKYTKLIHYNWLLLHNLYIFSISANCWLKLVTILSQDFSNIRFNNTFRIRSSSAYVRSSSGFWSLANSQPLEWLRCSAQGSSSGSQPSSDLSHRKHCTASGSFLLPAK